VWFLVSDVATARRSNPERPLLDGIAEDPALADVLAGWASNAASEET
jgi:hypothetical protein